MATVKQYHFTDDKIVEEALPIPTVQEVKDCPPILATFFRVNQTIIRPRQAKIQEELERRHNISHNKGDDESTRTGTNDNHQ